MLRCLDCVALSLVAVTNPGLSAEQRKGTLLALGIDRLRAGDIHHPGGVAYSFSEDAEENFFSAVPD